MLQIKFCKGSDPLTLPSGRVTSVGAELYGTDPIFFGKQMCDQDFGPAPPPDFTNRYLRGLQTTGASRVINFDMQVPECRPCIHYPELHGPRHTAACNSQHNLS